MNRLHVVTVFDLLGTRHNEKRKHQINSAQESYNLRKNYLTLVSLELDTEVITNLVYVCSSVKRVASEEWNLT